MVHHSIHFQIWISESVDSILFLSTIIDLFHSKSLIWHQRKLHQNFLTSSNGDRFIFFKFIKNKNSYVCYR